MPTLLWPSKAKTPLPSAALTSEAVIYPAGQGSPANRLILGDNLKVMAALLPEYEGRFDLIYADPPFFTNKRYPARIGRGEDSRRPREWQLAEGYADHWSDLDAYLDFIYPRLELMVRLLAPHGTLYLHLDWHVDAYVRLLLDELLGRERLLNEIIWVYHGPSPVRRAFNRKHDTLLAYTKSGKYTFNADAVREPYNPNTVKTFEASPRAGFGKIPDLERGKVPEDWWYFPVVARLHSERTGYPTQKPEALLERIVLASSRPGDLVADFFCGSGTLPLVATRHGRRFIACDVAWRAVHTTRLRLLTQETAFFLEREKDSSLPTTEANIGLEIAGRRITLQPGDLELDYWEVDPDWDGQLFRSVCQARRSHRLSDIPLCLDLPRPPRRLCVRAVTVGGDQIQIAPGQV